MALAMVAMLSLTVVLAAIGCAKKEESSTTTEATTPPVETPMDTMMTPDTSMGHADTTMH